MVTVCALPGGTARIRKVYSIATSDAIVLNYLHVLGDSDYKLSIDKSPIYSIIYINKCADGKKYHTEPTVQRTAGWCKAERALAGKSSRSSLLNGWQNTPVSSAGCSRYSAGLCWKSVSGRAGHVNESGTAESLMITRSLSLDLAGDKGFFFSRQAPRERIKSVKG